MDRLEASLSISGMTCASCSNTILSTLEKSDWISKASVDLLNNSATVEFIGEDSKAQQIVAAIEELGYEAHLDQVKAHGVVEDPNYRAVDIRVDGFHCELCPNRVATGLLALSGQGTIEIVNEPTKDKPIMTIKYAPASSKLNIRRILAAIQAIDPAFQASIYHPPSTEERSRRIHARQQKRILFRLVGTVLIAIPTFIIGIVYMSLVSQQNSTRQYLEDSLTDGITRAQIALLIMATPVYFCAADLFHRRALKELWMLWKPSSKIPVIQRFYRFGSMNMLMSLGTTIAYVSSLAQIIAAAVHPPSGMVDDSNFYFDSVVFLTLFLLAGRLIEAYSKSRTGDAVEMLGKLRPTTALLVEPSGDYGSLGAPQPIAAELLDFGDIIQIAHGASPPCDGEVVRGETQFDESSLTGESRLIKKSVGDGVFAGTVNKGNPIQVQITGVAGQSMLDKIVEVVREGLTKRAPMEKIADTLTAYFVPAITLVAILTWLIWFILGMAGAIPHHWLNDSTESWAVFALQFAIAVFVVACPCGLGLAAPTAIYVGGGLAAKYGILAKGGGEAFEKASHIKCVVFDKTGTLTQGGEPQVTDHEICPVTKQPSLVFSAIEALEQYSSHPIAKALRSFCSRIQDSQAVDMHDVDEIPGKGLKGTCNDFEIIVGNARLMQDFNVDMSSALSLDTWKNKGHSVALAATKTPGQDSYQLAVYFGISDPIRPETVPVISALNDQGVDVWMLSGDNIITARAVAQRIGIPEQNVIAEVLPTDKAAKVSEIKASMLAKHKSVDKSTIAMVGDGINDAPALAIADVGIAIGSGTDVAISSADFVLVNSDLRSVVNLLGLSKTVFRRIKFNFGWALIYNLLAVPFAAGCFYALGVKLDPVWASLAMALSSISVVLSSLALRLDIPFLGFRAREIHVGVV